MHGPNCRMHTQRCSAQGASATLCGILGTQQCKARCSVYLYKCVKHVCACAALAEMLTFLALLKGLHGLDAVPCPNFLHLLLREGAQVWGGAAGAPAGAAVPKVLSVQKAVVLYVCSMNGAVQCICVCSCVCMCV